MQLVWAAAGAVVLMVVELLCVLPLLCGDSLKFALRPR